MPDRRCTPQFARPSLTASPTARSATYSSVTEWDAYDRHAPLYRDSGRWQLASSEDPSAVGAFPFRGSAAASVGLASMPIPSSSRPKGGYGPDHALHEFHEDEGGVARVRKGIDPLPVELRMKNLQTRLQR